MIDLLYASRVENNVINSFHKEYIALCEKYNMTLVPEHNGFADLHNGLIIVPFNDMQMNHYANRISVPDNSPLLK